MPATRSKQKGQKQVQHVNNQLVNQLPSEILANIFIICVHLCDSGQDEIYGDYDCQVALTTVCRRWRSIAIETPQLWTRVSLPDPMPWASSALYLARSGSNLPLEICLVMADEFWENTEEGTTEELTERAEETLAFIVSHGGVTSRWQSVTITTDTFGPHRAVIDFLRTHPLPELRYLELVFEGPSVYDENDEDEEDLYEATTIQPLPLFQHPPSKLNTAKLAGVPNPFLFGHTNQLSLSPLTRLELTFVLDHPSLFTFASLLKEIGQLEVLRLDFSGIDGDAEVLEQDMTKVNLPRLQEFALIEVPDPLWPLNLVKMLDAPNVEHLELDLIDCGVPGEDDDLIGYIVNGGDQAAPRPAFPSVTHLGIRLYEYPRTINKLLKALLLAHPQVTRLDAPFMNLDALNASPRIVPNLQYLRVAECPGSEIRRIIASRTRAKAPLKIVESDIHSKRLISSEDMGFILSKVELRFYDSLNESRAPNGDEEDDEDEDSDFGEWEDMSDLSTE